jgi:hypothetical protein
MTEPRAIPPMALRVASVAVVSGQWFRTRSLLRDSPDGTGILGDGLHTPTARIHAFLLSNPLWADGLLIVSSLGIDVVGCFVLGYSVFGPSVRPFVGLMFVLGQWGGPAWAIVGVLVALFEMTTVIVLRAHYTMDVFAGAVTAFSAAAIAAWIAPTSDHWLLQLGQRIGLSQEKHVSPNSQQR